jgi:ribosome recycling factor
MIRLSIPPLTEERRKQLVKIVHGQVEEGKVAVRNIRRDAVHQLQKLLADKQISEDDERRGLDEIQKLTDRKIGEVDAVLAAKEQEILKV